MGAENGAIVGSEITDADVNIVMITGDGDTVTINSDLVTDLTIADLNHTINIQSIIRMLRITAAILCCVFLKMSALVIAL